MHQSTDIETPSGKGADDENFPVGSFLLPRALRPHVATFYAYARAIDDIADNPALAPEDKIARLDRFADAVERGSDDPGLEKAARMYESLRETNITTRHCLDLISAFKQDSVKNRYETWDEVIDYCNRSAAPVGRYLLDLHGEDRGHYVFSDALCNALQVINHLQDCADDLAKMDRCYLPQVWLREAGATTDDLKAAKASPDLRVVLTQMVTGTDILLLDANRLPGALKSRRLACESAVIVRVAHHLTDKLRVEDPVAARVELNRWQKFGCLFGGIAQGLFGGRT